MLDTTCVDSAPSLPNNIRSVVCLIKHRLLLNLIISQLNLLWHHSRYFGDDIGRWRSDFVPDLITR